MNKARDPPSLSYLAIFNTTLQPPGPVPEDDEDADEQAHVLFYTSRDRAASRDQMLRRVGLGKALIHFTELFQADDVCNNVHSLSKRMVILSPEPNFWILAGVDLARSIKVDADKGKENTKGKAKEQQQPSQIPNKSGLQYEYYDGSLNDIALKANLKRGYEQFKLTHGSFGSVLSISGREALELQLERFFTVWAWSWDFEEGQDFSDHLGIKIHPMHNTLTPLLDEYQKLLPEGCSSIMINPPCIIPSTNFVKQKYPPSLSRHLLSLVPQRRPEPPSKEIIEGSAPREGALKGKHVQSQTALAGPSSNPNKLLGMPAMSLNMNMNMNMDVRKWGWPGYLTFGKGVTTRKPADDKEREPSQKEGPPPPEEQVTEESEEPQGGLHRSKAIDIDQDALYDAITSANNSYSNRSDALTENLSPDEDLQGSTLTARPQAEVDEGETNMASPAVVDTMVTESVLSAPIASASSSLSRLFEQSVPEPGESEPAPEFFLINVHLPVSPEILSTRRRRVYYLVRGYAALALVVTDEGRLETQISSFAELANEVLGKAQVLVDEEATKTAPHAANIVLAKGQHIISTAGYVETNDGGFTSKSEHLYNGQQMLEKYLNVHEVFSRGQNPQHWHVARRGLGTDNDGKAVAGDVYLEVLRKEASLPDVENILIGVIRRFKE